MQSLTKNRRTPRYDFHLQWPRWHCMLKSLLDNEHVWLQHWKIKAASYAIYFTKQKRMSDILYENHQKLNVWNSILINYISSKVKISWLMCLTSKLFVRFEVVAERKAEDWRTDGSRNIFIRRKWILYYLVFKISRFLNSICQQVNWNNRTLSFEWWKYFL